MAVCPHCKKAFERPTVTRIKEAGFQIRFLYTMMATCPECDVVLSVYGA